MIRTRITEMFGIQYPILCGAMMWLCKPPLCAAVSNAGGMGNLTAANYETEETFRAAIREVRTLTGKPFMVNVTILPSVRISGAPIDKACGPEFMEMLRKAGVRMFHKVGSVRHALHAQEAGYDGVYAAGIEEGGHPLNDDVTTMVLTPRVVESVSIPVVTVGGIADGRSLAAALMLGAEGVMMATRFMATKECQVHDNIKQEIVRRQEQDTTLICKSIHLQARALRNRNVEDILAIEKRGGGFEEILPLIMGKRISEAWDTGNVDLAPMMVGQSVGLVRDIPSCAELLERMTREAEERVSAVRDRIR